MKYLSENALKTYFTSENSFLGDRIEAITDILKADVIVHADKTYVFEEKVNTWKRTEGTLNELLRSYIEKSTKLILNENPNFMKCFYRKTVDTIRNLSVTQHYENIFRDKLRRNLETISWDDDCGGIHFLNGRFNLRTGTLEARTREHYQTRCIQYDYEPTKVKSKSMKKIIKLMSQIHPNQEEREFMRYTIGCMLTGKRIDQTFMVAYGKGSSGKSTEMDFLYAILGDIYMYEVPANTFDKGNEAGYNKICSEISRNHRIIRTEELSSKQQDASKIKRFVDGVVTCTRLYTEGSHRILINGVLYVISNHMLNFMIDSGLARRILGLEYKSHFTEDKNQLNDSQHIYLKDKTIIDELTDADKMAIFNYFVKGVGRFYEGYLPKIPETVIESTETLKDSNDNIQSFVDSELQITNDKSDRIHRLRLQEYFNAYCKKFQCRYNVDESTLVQVFKERGLKYDRQAREKGGNAQGCFVGVKHKISTDEKSAFTEEDFDTNSQLAVDVAVAEQEERIKKMQTRMDKLEEMVLFLKTYIEKEDNPVKESNITKFHIEKEFNNIKESNIAKFHKDLNEIQNDNFDKVPDLGIKLKEEKLKEEKERLEKEMLEEMLEKEMLEKEMLEKEKPKEKKPKQRKTKEGKEIISSKGYGKYNILFD